MTLCSAVGVAVLGLVEHAPKLKPAPVVLKPKLEPELRLSSAWTPLGEKTSLLAIFMESDTDADSVDDVTSGDSVTGRFGFGFSQAEHLAVLGWFLTQQISHSHSPSFARNRSDRLCGLPLSDSSVPSVESGASSGAPNKDGLVCTDAPTPYVAVAVFTPTELVGQVPHKDGLVCTDATTPCFGVAVVTPTEIPNKSGSVWTDTPTPYVAVAVVAPTELVAQVPNKDGLFCTGVPTPHAAVAAVTPTELVVQVPNQDGLVCIDVPTPSVVVAVVTPSELVVKAPNNDRLVCTDAPTPGIVLELESPKKLVAGVSGRCDGSVAPTPNVDMAVAAPNALPDVNNSVDVVFVAKCVTPSDVVAGVPNNDVFVFAAVTVTPAELVTGVPNKDLPRRLSP